jgi:hypothetical protein
MGMARLTPPIMSAATLAVVPADKIVLLTEIQLRCGFATSLVAAHS